MPDLLRVEHTGRRKHHRPAAEEHLEGSPLRGHVHQRWCHELHETVGGNPIDQLVGIGDRPARELRVAAAHRGEEDVLVAPEHALRQPGGSTGVRAVDVLTRTTDEVTSIRCSRESIAIANGSVDRFRAPIVVDDKEGTERRCGCEDRGDSRREALVIHQRDHIRVREQVGQLPFDVAVVDVHGDRTELETAEHHLEMFGAVPQHQTDVIAGTNPPRGQVMGNAVRPDVKRRVRQPFVEEHDRVTIPNRVGHPLEEFGEVETHPSAAFRSTASASGIPAAISQGSSTTSGQVATPKSTRSW